jgi:hypothetical protein
MEHFAGLDVSVKETSICIVDGTGRIVREVKVASEPEDLLKVLGNPIYRFSPLDCAERSALAIDRLSSFGGELMKASSLSFQAGVVLLVVGMIWGHPDGHIEGPRGDARACSSQSLGLCVAIPVRILLSSSPFA